MPRSGFRLNYRNVGQLLKTDPGGIAAVDAAAQAVLARVEHDDTARIEHYTTDRYVAGVVVDAAAQAKHGAATRAVSAARGR